VPDGVGQRAVPRTTPERSDNARFSGDDLAFRASEPPGEGDLKADAAIVSTTANGTTT
jgi:hypothetical protein